MPNWCRNKLTVETSDDEGASQLAEFLDTAKAQGTVLSLEALIPTPKELIPDRDARPAAQNEAVFTMPGWWTWRCENWGTKWDVEAELVERGACLAVIEFDSAWGPPVPLLETVSRRFPRLQFTLEYDEPFGDFSGRLCVQNGEVHARTHGKSPSALDGV